MSDLKITSGVVIHGGVGTPSPEQTTPELDAAYRETLSESLRAGGETLRAGALRVGAWTPLLGEERDALLAEAFGALQALGE